MKMKSLTMKRNPRFFCVSLCITVSMIILGIIPSTGQDNLPGDDGAKVQIFPGTIVDKGGYTEVQEVFGIMTGNMDARASIYLVDANIQGIRNIINWLPKKGEYGFNFPSWAGGLKPQFDDRQASVEWFDRFIERDPYPLWDKVLNVELYFDDRYGDVSVTLSPRPALFDGRMERNMEASKKHLEAYIQALKNLIPSEGKSQLKYFQLQNEPNQSRFWAGMFYGNQKKTVASYTRVFNGLYDYLKSKHPDVIFLGTCVGHNGTYKINSSDSDYSWEEEFNQDTSEIDWNTWVKYFIDHVENPEALEYYNPNSYCIPSIRQLANVSMTQNYAENTRGVRPRYVITETSAPIKGSRAKIYQNQFLFHANDIFMMLHHPDKFAARHAFVASDKFPGNYSFFTITEDNEFRVEAPYWVFLTFQNLRGKHVHYESDNENIRVFATASPNDRLVIGLFNPTGKEQTINLDPRIPGNQFSRVIKRKAVYDLDVGNAHYSEDEWNTAFPVSLDLEPESVHVVELSLKQPLEFTKTYKTRTFYGDQAKQPMDKKLKVDISVPGLPQENEKVWLRIGIDQRQESGQYQFKFNGKSHTINWEDTPETTIESWNYMSGYIEIPLETKQIKRKNKLKLEALPDNMLLFTSIVYEGPER